MFQAGGDFMWYVEALAFKKERKKGFDLLGGGLDEVILGLGLYKCVGSTGSRYEGRMFSDDDGLM